MQKIATKVFIYSSVAFGVVGILMIVTGGLDDGEMQYHIKVLQKILFVTVCIILSSFALSIAGKYLSDKS
jgi:hypothetical protein